VAGDRRAYADRRLRETASMKALEVKSTEAVTIDGLDGYEALALAEDAKGGGPMAVYQVMLFDGSGYILMQGIMGAAHVDEYLPEFKAMARSLSRRPSPKDQAEARHRPFGLHEFRHVDSRHAVAAGLHEPPRLRIGRVQDDAVADAQYVGR
jgi:hypothetical protein